MIGDIIKLVDSNTGELASYEEVTVYADGTPMDDSKLDPAIYRKRGGVYYKRAITGPINVKWFGAKGDDTTDDTQSFLNTIAFAKKANHGEIYIPKGIYKITSRLYLDFDNVYIHGDGKTSSILNYYYQQVDRTATFYTEYLNSCITTHETDWVNNYKFSSFGIVYKGDYIIKNPDEYYGHGWGAISGIFIPRINNLIIDDLYIDNFNHCGIAFDYPLMPANFGNSTNVTIQNCTLLRGNFANILAKNVSHITVNHNIINEAGVGYPDDMAGVTGYGCAFAPYNGNRCDDIIVSNNNFTDNNRKGLDSHGCLNITASGNNFSGNRAAQCAIIYGSGTIRVINNLFADHKELIYIPERGHYSFVSLITGCGSASSDPGGTNYSINITGNIFRDVDINSGETFVVAQVLTDADHIKLNFSNNIMRIANTNIGLQITSSSHAVTGNKAIISNNILSFEGRVGTSALVFSNIEDYIITSNEIFVNSQGISLNNVNIAGRNPLQFDDINTSNLKTIVFCNNHVNGFKWDGVDTGDPLTQNYIPVTDFYNMSLTNRTNKLIAESNWLNGVKDVNSDSYLYTNSLVGNSYEGGVSRILSPRGSSASYYLDIGKTGALIIKFPKIPVLPSGVPSYIRRISFDVNVLSTPGTSLLNKNNFKFTFSTYLYVDGSTSPSIRNSAVSVETRESTPIKHRFRVGFGSDSFPYLVVDDTTSVWDRASVTITNLQISGLNTEVADYQKGFTLSINPDISSIAVGDDIIYNEPRLLSQATTQPASTATDIETVVTDLNTLITKLKTAGIMAS